MTMGRLKHIHLVLMLGISLFIPPSLGLSLYVDLSESALPSSDMSFEDADDEDSSTCQNEFKAFVPKVSTNPLLLDTHFDRKSSFCPSPLTSYTQITSVLRC